MCGQKTISEAALHLHMSTHRQTDNPVPPGIVEAMNTVTNDTDNGTQLNDLYQLTQQTDQGVFNSEAYNTPNIVAAIKNGEEHPISHWCDKCS